jgi:hypothetical protein
LAGWLLPFGFSLSFASANCGRLLAGCQLESFSIHQLVKNFGFSSFVLFNPIPKTHLLLLLYKDISHFVLVFLDVGGGIVSTLKPPVVFKKNILLHILGTYGKSRLNIWSFEYVIVELGIGLKFQKSTEKSLLCPANSSNNTLFACRLINHRE